LRTGTDIPGGGRADAPTAASDGFFASTAFESGVYSVNVPVPSAVARLAGDLSRELPAARARERGTHTLVCKRLGDGTGDGGYHRLEARVREAVSGTPPFRARVTGVEQFATAVTDPSPVVYLAVESPGLVALHERLCDAFDPVADLEGDDYVPHVTIARGGSPERAAALCETDVDPVEWTVTELSVRSARHDRSVTTVSLPA